MVINGQLIAMEGSIGGLTGQMCTEVAESRELVTEARTSQQITIYKSLVLHPAFIPQCIHFCCLVQVELVMPPS